MNDVDKPKDVLIHELNALRQRVAELETLYAECRQTEEAFRESEARYRCLFEDSPISLWEEDFSAIKNYLDDLRISGISDFRAYLTEHPEAVAHCASLIKVRNVNQATLRLFNRETKGDLLGSAGVRLILSKAFLNTLRDELIDLTAGKTRFQHILTGERRQVLVNITVAPGYESTWEKIIVSIVDVTERKRIEDELRKSEARYRAIVQDQTELISRFTPDYTLTFVNDAYCRYFGQTREAMLGMSILSSIPDEDREAVISLFATLTPETPTGSIENRNLIDDKIRWQQWTVRAIYDEQAHLIEYQTVDRDITERKQVEAALVEERNLLRTLIDNMPDAIYIKDTASRFLLANDATVHIMGTTPEDLVGKTDFDFYPEDLAKRYYTDEQTIIETGQALVGKEEIVINQDGNPSWYLTTKVPFWDGQGGIGGIVGIGRDITRHKEMEQALRQARDELETRIEQRTAELREANEQLSTLYQVGQTITTPLQLRVVLDVIAHSTAELLGSDTGVILLLDEAGETLTIQGAYGLSEQVVQGTRDQVGESIAGRVVQTGQPIIANDLPHDPRFYNPSAAEEGLLACASVPLNVGGKIIGTLDVHSKRDPNAFNEDHIQVLSMLANQAAIAIENARLYDALQVAHDQLEVRVQQRTSELQKANERLREEVEERKQTEKAERDQRTLAEALRDSAAAIIRTLNLDDVLEQILINVERVVPHDAANIMLIEDGVAQVARARGWVERGLGDWISTVRFVVDEVPEWSQFLTGMDPQAYVITDTHADPRWLMIPEAMWIYSTAKAPIHIAEHLIGILHLDSATPDFFTQEHLDRLQAFADQAAVAIRNAQLFQAEQRRRQVAETLVKAVAVLNSTLELNQVLELILQQLHAVIEYDSGSIQQLEDKELMIVACQGFERPANVLGLRFPVDDPKFPNMRVVTDRVPLALDDITLAYPHFQEEAADYESGHIHTWLGLPLLSKDRLIGMIALDRLDVHPFADDDINLAVAFANQAAVAIENAHLYERVQRHAEELEERVAERTAALQRTTERVEAILNNSPDAILLLRANGTIRNWNPAFDDLFGYRADEALGQSSMDLFDLAYAPVYEHALACALSEHQSSRFEAVARRKDGETFDADVALAPVKEANVVTGVVCSVRDISALKEVERMKDAFVSNVTHELRTPITNLKLRHHLLETQPDRLDVHLPVMQRETERLTRIIEDLLLLSRLDQDRIAFKPAPVDLNTLLREYGSDRQLLAASRGLTLTVVEQPGNLPVRADAGLLGQVLSILLTNALNYTPTRGHVTMSTQHQTFEGTKWVGFSVGDTGPGIPRDEQAHLFKRFFRGTVGQQSGTAGVGLGLALAKEIVDRHGGRIEVESEGVPGQGVTVRVWLPSEGEADG